MIPVYKPFLPPRAMKYAHDALDSTWVSSQGRYMELAEDELRKWTKVKNILLTNNGTTANHLMAKCLRLRTTRREIVVPSNVYVAAWNPLKYDGFFRLKPVDMDLATWNADLENKLHGVGNLLVVHNLGNVQDVRKILEKYPDINIIQDACEAFGGEYYDEFSQIPIYAGKYGLGSTFSFYGNKNITTGEGGAFVTDDDELYEYARLIWGQGQSQEKFVHTELGYNYRMTNVQAALLYGQLQVWPEILSRKVDLWWDYHEQLKDVEGVQLQAQEPTTSHALWMFGVRFLGQSSYEYAKIFFDAVGIETRPFFYTINKHKHLKGIHTFPNGELLEKEIVIFPSYPELTKKEIDYICKEIKIYAGIVNS